MDDFFEGFDFAKRVFGFMLKSEEMYMPRRNSMPFIFMSWRCSWYVPSCIRNSRGLLLSRIVGCGRTCVCCGRSS